jgi:hypothetical protein
MAKKKRKGKEVIEPGMIVNLDCKWAYIYQTLQIKNGVPLWAEGIKKRIEGNEVFFVVAVKGDYIYLITPSEGFGWFWPKGEE